ncbi:hypothetical protein C7999DRAFT_12736 [Corynascus novoguineensis]|uniref:D-xylose 1-dehydrogenase (NADP(+), D-xylono-1,5-lactone-forming) n=1 Tax=Corynascus novoguineensis TaxID=1126955 RepID=A0AAN7HRZ8_9PEZI|nr:hypothetical protein C7999DRAFT_12736 [Corynascus novoguineensis]
MPSHQPRFNRAVREERKTAARRMFRFYIKPPNIPPKNENALRFGILGPASSLYTILILPAVYHADIKVHALASNSRKTIEEWRRRYNIRRTYTSYQALLDDAEIDAVVIALPGPFCLEWTIRALAKGKHVLLDSPGMINADDADRLFNGPFVKSPNCPVLLECTPYRFHPSWLEFERAINRSIITHVKILVVVPVNFDKDKCLRFRFEHGGGTRLDMVYATSLMRAIYAADPVECLRSEIDMGNLAAGYHGLTQYDVAWLFPNGAVGEMKGVVGFTERAKVPVLRPDAGVTIEVMHRRVEVPMASSAPPNRRMMVRRKVRLRYRDGAPSRHRLTIEEEAVYCDAQTGLALYKSRHKKPFEAYTLRASDRANRSLPESKPYWTAPLYQLDAFVNRVHSTSASAEPSAAPASNDAAWVTPADSLARARMLHAGLREANVIPPSPSEFQFEDLQLTAEELERFAEPRDPQPDASHQAQAADSSLRAEGPSQAESSRQAEGFTLGGGPHQPERYAQAQARDLARLRRSRRSSGFIRAWLDALSAKRSSEKATTSDGPTDTASQREFYSAPVEASYQIQRSNAQDGELPTLLRTPADGQAEVHESAEIDQPTGYSRTSTGSQSSAQTLQLNRARLSVRISRLAQVLGPNHIRVRALRYFQSLKSPQSREPSRASGSAHSQDSPQGQTEDEEGPEMPDAQTYEPPSTQEFSPTEQSAPSQTPNLSQSRRSVQSRISTSSNRLASVFRRSQTSYDARDAAQAGDDNTRSLRRRGEGEEPELPSIVVTHADTPLFYRVRSARRSFRGREGRNDPQG